MGGHHVVDHLTAHVVHGFRHVFRAHQFDALLEDRAALVVHHIVELQQVLADVEVARLDLLLRLFKRLVDPGVDDRLTFLKAELLQHPVHAVGAEDAHQVVFEREVEFRAARVALTAGAAAQLIVDAAAFVAFGADHVETARFERELFLRLDVALHFGNLARALSVVLDAGRFIGEAHVEIAAELDVGAATGHVGRNRHAAGHARLRHDMGFLLVVARVQHLVLHLLLFQKFGKRLGFLDRGGADEYGLSARRAVLDLDDHRLVFLARRAIDLVVLVDTGDGSIGRNFQHIEAVDVAEFARFRQRRAGHARQLFVHAEVVLEGDRGERLVLRLDLHALLGFERLVQPVRIAAAFHHAAGELVDDDDLVGLDDVVLVFLEELVRA